VPVFPLKKSHLDLPGSPRDICGGQGGTGIGFSLRTSGFLSEYHFTNAPHSKATLNL